MVRVDLVEVTDPLVIPPPPDHCHITACTLDRVTPPKNRAQVEVPGTHQPMGGGEMCLVPSVYVHSSRLGTDEALPVPKIELQICGEE